MALPDYVQDEINKRKSEDREEVSDTLQPTEQATPYSNTVQGIKASSDNDYAPQQQRRVVVPDVLPAPRPSTGAPLTNWYKQWRDIKPGFRKYTGQDVQRRLPEREGMQLINREWGYAMERQLRRPNQSYFAQDPKRLAKFHYFLSSAPDDWQPPEWLDPEKYSDAFNYMRELHGEDWTKWEQLDPEDPTGIYLTSLGEPPPEFRLPNEISNEEELLNYISNLPVDENGLISLQNMDNTELQKLNDSMYGETKELSPFMQQGTWESLESWQKTAMSIFSPQPMEDRPEWSRLTAAGFQGLQAGVAGMAIGATAGAVGSLPGMAIGAILGLGIGTAAGYQAYTGQEIPGINKLLTILDYGAIATEKLVGLAVQSADGETKEVLNNLPEAWKAGEFTYEASGVGTKALNIMSGTWQIAENVFNGLGGDVEWSSGKKANYNAGQIWALERAIVEPYMVKEGYLGGESLDRIRSELISGGDFHDLYAQYVSQYGFSGTVGDFIAQSLLDPMNFVPGMQGEIIGKIASKVDNPSIRANLTQAVYLNQGSILKDALPMGTKWMADLIQRRRKPDGTWTQVKGSGGVFDIMRTYKNIIRHSELQTGFMPTKTIMEAAPLSLSNPDLFSDINTRVVDAVSNNITTMADGQSLMVNHDGIKADLRSYIETQLNSIDIDPNQNDVKRVVDHVIDNYDNVVTDVAMNNRGNNDADFNQNLQQAFTEYLDETIGSMRWGEQSTQIKYYPELSDWERNFAGLTEEGGFAELDPTNKPKNWLQKLSKLTPESQAITHLHMLYTNLAGILTGMENNVDGQYSLVKQMAGIDPVIVGQHAGNLINSPAVKTTMPAMRSYVDSGGLDALYTAYISTAEIRSDLNTVADALGLTNGALVENMKSSPSKIVNMINNLDSRVLDSVRGLSPEELQAKFEVYLGDRVIPFNDEHFTATLLADVSDHADKFLVDHYGIKAKPAINRLTSAMKSLQSLAVLGFNPLYMVYNYVNNLTTRAAQGVFGLLLPKTIKGYYERFRVKPAMLDVGIGLAGLPDDRHMGGQAIAAAMDVDDWIGKVRTATSKAAKLGVFSNLAAKIEVAESRQATTIGIMQAMDKLWQPGIGFDKLDPNIEMQLREFHPNAPEFIYSMAQQGLNVEEITNSIYTQSKFQGIQSTMERAIQQVFTDSPEKARDLFVKSGVKDILVEMLGENPDVNDITRAFDYVQNHMDAFIEQGISNDLMTIPDDVKNRIQSEGVAAMMPMWGEIWSHFTARRLIDHIDFQKVAAAADAARGQGDWDTVRRLWNGQFAAADAKWKRTHNVMLVTAQGMIDAIGVDNPHAQEYVNIMSNWMDGWDKWHTDKQAILRETARGNRKWQSAFDQISKNYDAHINTEKLQLVSMFESLGKWYEETSHRPATEIMEWGQNVISAWDEASNAVKEFRSAIDGTEQSPAQRRQAFETFNTETFAPLIKAQQQAMIEGAQFLARIQPTAQQQQPGVPLLPPGGTTGGTTNVASTLTPPSVRFADATQLRNEINTRANNIGDITVTDNQRTMLARLLSEVYPNTEERHAVQRFLFDTNSVKMAKGSKVKAALDLFISIDEQGNNVYTIPDNIKTALQSALDLARQEAGQLSLDTKPADIASESEKAQYNEQRITNEAQQAVDEQKIHSDALMTRKAFNDKIRTAFNLSREQQTAVMSLVDAHAEIWGKNNGKSSDAWYSEKIQNVVNVDLDTYLKDYGDKSRHKRVLGQHELLENGKSIILGLEKADVTTAVHELAHVFRYELNPSEMDTFVKWVGFESTELFYQLEDLWRTGDLKEGSSDYEIYIGAEELFAKGFEQYLMDEMALDVAPPAIINIFKKFANWLKTIYNNVTRADAPNVDISPEMKNLYNRLLFDQDMVDARQSKSQKLKHYPTGVRTDALGVNTNAKYNFQFKVVDLFDLITSHTVDFMVNPLYPQELQARFRELISNKAQVIDIAQKLAPDALLNDTRMVETGPMIIGPDMVVESGNGRTLALAIALRDYPQNFKAYVDALTTRLDEYGISPEAIEGVDNPILVRLRLDDVDRIEFANDANGSRVGQFTTLEQSYVDANVWTKDLLSELKVYSTTDIDAILRSNNNEGIVQKFINGLPQSEKSKMFDAQGNLSKYGIEKMKSAIYARVFKGDRGRMLVSIFTETDQATVPSNVVSATENVLGEIAKVEGMIENNQIYPEMSIAKDITDVLSSYLEINRRYGSFAEFLKKWEDQASIYGDAYNDIGLVEPNATPETRKYKIDLLHFYAENARKTDPQTQLWKRYANKLFNEPAYIPGQIDMFGAQPTPKHELITSTIQDLVNEGKVGKFRDYKPNLQSGLPLDRPSLKQTRVATEVPQAGTPAPLYNGRLLDEVYSETLQPLLDQMKEIAYDDMENGQAFALGDLPEDTNLELQAWLDKLPQQMAGTKLTAMRYGEMMRNRALLNYQERYGIDDYMNMVFPYQFWFTRTLGEWAKRSIEKPAWISMYARIRSHQKRMEDEGIPSRLKGKMRIPAPFLPDWMGNALYVDPLNQLFPFSQFATPFEMTAQQGQNVEYAAIQSVQDMVAQGRLTAKQAEKIILEKEGPIWNEALAEGQVQQQQEGDLNAMNLTSMMMTPAMWWTYPYHIMKGTPEQLYPLPGTRTGQALREYGGPLGVIGEVMAYPEEAIRKKFNLSAYGEWGDYYVDRTLANMAAEGVISSREAEIAMMEKQGEAYDLAYDRVQKEMALKIPGSQTALALKEGKLGGVLYTLPTTLFPAGLLPEGELIQRGLKVEYSKAWDALDEGDPEAINKFFEKYPEYQARIALFDEPQERLQQFLVSELWDKWHELEEKNKPLVVDQLGPDFEMMFLNEETQDFTAIDNQTLAYWTQRMGGFIPETDETGQIKDAPLYQQEGLKLYKPEVLAQVEEYYALRDQLYPNYKELQDAYYSLPEDQRKGFVKQNPVLEDYWDWKDEYKDEHPDIKAYEEEQKKLYEKNEDIYTTSLGQTPSAEEMTAQVVGQNMIPALQMQVLFSYYSGKEVEGSAKGMLIETWKSLGSPGESFEAWMAMVFNEIIK